MGSEIIPDSKSLQCVAWLPRLETKSEVDYYSSTVEALRVVEDPDDKYLPRVLMFLDRYFEWGISYIGDCLAIV